jgi:hypothetical protein
MSLKQVILFLSVVAVISIPIYIGIDLVRTAKASDNSSHVPGVTLIQVTEYSKYIVDHRFGGTCYYETASSVGIYVNRVEDAACLRMLKGAE